MKSRWWLVVLSLVMVAGLVVTSCAPKEVAPPEVKEPFKLGLTAAITGYAAVTYLAGAEYMRCYFEDLNDRGGIDGRKIELYIEDNRGEPPRAVSQAKSFVEKGVSLIVVHAPSATYGGVIAECERANIPLMIGVSSPPITLPPSPHPLVFQGFCSLMYDAACLWTYLLRVYDPRPDVKLGALGLDIPVSRATTKIIIDYWEKGGGKGFTAFVPAEATDLSAVASKFKADGIDYCLYAGPGPNSHMLYEALLKLGWKGTLFGHNFSTIEADIECAKRNNVKVLHASYFVPYQLGLPEHAKMMAMLKKYKAVDTGSVGIVCYVNSAIVEHIFRKAGYPPTTEKMLDVINNLDYNFAPIYGRRILSKTDHTGPSYQRLQLVHEDGRITIETNWFMTDALGKTMTDLGKELPKD